MTKLSVSQGRSPRVRPVTQRAESGFWSETCLSNGLSNGLSNASHSNSSSRVAHCAPIPAPL